MHIISYGSSDLQQQAQDVVITPVKIEGAASSNAETPQPPVQPKPRLRKKTALAARDSPRRLVRHSPHQATASKKQSANTPKLRATTETATTKAAPLINPKLVGPTKEAKPRVELTATDSISKKRVHVFTLHKESH